MKKIIVPFYLIILSIGCTNNNSSDKQELREKKEKASIELIKKYDALILNKSLNNYSYSFYEKLIQQKRFLAFKGYISDVGMNDSTLVIKVTSEVDDHLYIAQCTIKIENSGKLRESLKYLPNKKQRGIFIMKVLKVFSKSPSLEIEEGDSESDPYVSFGDLNTNIIFLKGELLDFYML